jgi:hypothetical protein
MSPAGRLCRVGQQKNSVNKEEENWHLWGLSTTLFSSSPSKNKSFAIARLFHRSNYFGKS